MKRLFVTCIICFLLSALGCAAINGENQIINDDSSTFLESGVPLHTQEPVLSGPLTTEASELGENNQPYCSPAVSGLTEWYYVPEIESGTAFPVTIISYDFHDSYIESKYYNDCLDFENVNIEIQSMNLNANTNTLHLSVTIPSEWKDEEKEWFIREGLCLNFYLNGEHVDAFRERELLLIADNRFEIIYNTCILKNYSIGDNLGIIPYVKEIKFIETNEFISVDGENGEKNNVRKQYHLSNGEVYSQVHQNVYNASESRRIVNKLEIRHDLSFAKSACIIEENKVDDSSYYVSLPVIVEDFAYSEQIGVYEKKEHQNLWTRGILYNREKDFSKLSIVVDSFHIWDESTELDISWYCPSDWTDAECRSLNNECAFDFLICLNDERPNWDELPFEARSNLRQGFLPRSIRCSYYNWDGDKFDWNWRETHLVYLDSMLTKKEWEEVQSITIIPFMYTFDEAIPSEGIVYQDGSEFNHDWHYIFLPELSVTIMITPDLFENGF